MMTQSQNQQQAPQIDKTKIYPLVVAAGIDRDGTQFSSNAWIDGEWVRFYRGLPKKIGGYQWMATSSCIITGCFVLSVSDAHYVFVGGYQEITANPDPTKPPKRDVFAGYFKIRAIDVASIRDYQYTIIDITPKNGATPVYFDFPDTVYWTFDTMYSGSGKEITIMAFFASNLSTETAKERDAYSTTITFDADGNVTTEPSTFTKFTGGSMPTISGGMVVLNPFLFIYSSLGYVAWSYPNKIDDKLASARICSTKIITAKPVRGGQNSPSGLFWSVDSLIRCSFIVDTNAGTTTGTTDNIGTFKYDIISSESSIISAASVVEVDGVFYWIGQSNFYCYTGVVQKLPNTTNMRYFFENLRANDAGRVWGTKVSSYNEIWWFYPSKDSLWGECDRAIIFNISENVWFDTPIERNCGYYSSSFGSPIWVSPVDYGADSVLGMANTYRIYQHEIGLNETGLKKTEYGAAIPPTPILFNIKSSFFSWAAQGLNGQRSSLNRNMIIKRFEPDIKQTSAPITEGSADYPTIQVYIYSKKYAASQEQLVDNFDITYFTEKIDLRVQGRLLSLLFSSNDLNAEFEMGQCLLIADVSDVRP